MKTRAPALIDQQLGEEVARPCAIAKEPREAAPRLTVSRPALLRDWRGAYQRAVTYLAALGGDEGECETVAVRAVERAAMGDGWTEDASAHTATMATIRREVTGADDSVPVPEVDERFDEWRFRHALGADVASAAALPPLSPGRVIPHRIEHRFLRRRLASSRTPDPWNEPDEGRIPSSVRARRLRMRWVRTAFFRRALLLTLVMIPTIIASQFMLQVLPNQGRAWLEIVITLFFGALFGWISIGFWTAIAGFVTLVSRRDRFAISATAPPDGERIDARARTAIVMPICEEPVGRVFAGLRATWASLVATGESDAFDLFILSDTADPSLSVKEEEAWLDWCREVSGFGRIFYRRRRIRVKRKSGNIADFCRRFGRGYRYMLTLDADSVMSGGTIVKLVKLAEENPAAGLIQTVPVSIHASSLYARLQQFANRVYGPLFATGMHYWQLGDAQYWGHNAIIRLAPFLEHCSLPRLPGKPPLGGEILSHDFVEAAMLGRAGYSIWMAYDVGGSYEELPSSLLEDLARDRRWCQGNFQHMRLVFVEGLFHFHRALFLNGILAYGSAFLWFLFLALSTAEAILRVVSEPEYFPDGPSLFPQWPVWRPDWAFSLFSVTLAILFLPKVLSAIWVFFQKDGARPYGGGIRFVLSILLEFIASSFFAPIRMLFHTKFVLTNLAGRIVAWKSPPRGQNETSWGLAIRQHSGATVIGLVWGIGVYWQNPEYAWWLMPILGALVLSAPISVFMSWESLGQGAKRAGLFLTPEETSPPEEVRLVDEATLAAQAKERALPPLERDGFVRAVVDPYVNVLHRRLLRGRRHMSSAIEASRKAVVERAVLEGPSAVSTRERRRLLMDPERLDELHRRVWGEDVPERARRWGRPERPSEA